MDRRELPPPWLDARIEWNGERHAPLARRVKCDVAVVGAGITGLSTALMLARAGKRVVVLEAERVGAGETGRTSAHATHVVDAWLPELAARHGESEAKMLWDGAKLGLETIARQVAAEGIDCDFARVPAVIYGDDPLRLAEFAALARQIGYACRQEAPEFLPFAARMILSFEGQARLHPLKYLAGLVRGVLARGGHVHEGSRVTEVRPAGTADGVRVVSEGGGEVVCEHVVVAAHVPFHNRVFLHTKQAPYRTYCVALRVAKGSFPDALLVDMGKPYHYLRLQPRAQDDLLILGGEDHKTGQEGDHEGTLRFERLARHARERLGIDAPVEFQWSGQVLQPHDELPFIGLNVHSRDEFLATGFSGDGMVYGTLAAHMITQRIFGRTTPWDDLLDPARIELEPHAVAQFVGENKDYPVHMLKDWFVRREAAEGPAGLRPGQGGLFKVNGRRIAVSRAANGQLLAVSPACPHLGCGVHWNEAETTWDCPCHGSRFSAEGAVINGPAAHDLDVVELVLDPVPAPGAPVVAEEVAP